ncbi:MAG: 30S ribosomal protein S4 [Alphaproteobacteria bacterium]|nr:30S ribosomal protein S4 [Alphaproteobacteria bacterium]
MAKRTQAKHKIDRRLGVNLWGRAKSPFNKREYGPGQHGQNRKKPTDYGVQLHAKQKLRGYYANIGERRFYRYYQEAIRRRGDSGLNLIELLERRLDAVIYRLKFVPTVFAARQFVSHGHVKVNGKRVTISSYSVRDGDVIEVTEKARQIPIYIQGSTEAGRDVPGYLEADHDKGTGKFIRAPKFEEVPYPAQMEPNLIIEFYSR